MFKPLITWAGLCKEGFQQIADAGKPEHFEALGRFVMTVSNNIDGTLNSCLQAQISSGEEAVTRIVVGEMRIGDIMAALTRIATARKLDAGVLDGIKGLFSEISILRHVRDLVVHRACMVNGDQLAFHNAFLAKTDTAIEVSIYSLAELNEFIAYAHRLGHRVIRLFEILYPIRMSPVLLAYIETSALIIFLNAGLAIVESEHIPREKVMRIRELQKSASAAIKAYSDSARKTDDNFSKLQQESTIATAKFVAAMASVLADETSLLEIPVRLRKKDRAPQKGISRSRARAPRSSQT